MNHCITEYDATNLIIIIDRRHPNNLEDTFDVLPFKSVDNFKALNRDYFIGFDFKNNLLAPTNILFAFLHEGNTASGVRSCVGCYLRSHNYLSEVVLLQKSLGRRLSS